MHSETEGRKHSTEGTAHILEEETNGIAGPSSNEKEKRQWDEEKRSLLREIDKHNADRQKRHTNAKEVAMEVISLKQACSTLRRNTYCLKSTMKSFIRETADWLPHVTISSFPYV